ncbi:MAG: thioredoxin-disulfide reductase [Candidatus Pacebacteria bacterium]|nr:thioredoxin-disulfide reductase [Candidatus Paceibacterota bacterium]
MEKLVIAGAGCAGLTAAIYAARADLNPLVLTGSEPGGQLAETTTVENYPGFADGVMGPEIMMGFQKQAERFGARSEHAEIVSCSLSPGGPHELLLSNDKQIVAQCLIIATGARPRWLGIPSEQALRNRGVSSCATCDGALYRDVPIVVVGGGDSAVEDALFLSRFGSTVTLIHRRDELRASKIMQERAFANEKIDILWDSLVEDILDVEKNEVTGVVVRNVKTNETTTIDCNAVFIAIGHVPNTDPFKGQVTLDDRGYVQMPDCGRSLTTVDGVFTAGDCADHIYQQAITAAGMGCRAALDAERWLESHFEE